jgi:nucleotide-binding universal stress UspA family protein
MVVRRHMMMNQRNLRRRGRPIVVGVDGSPSSRAALRWALEQAERTTASVEAVIVWAREPVFYYGYEWASVAVADEDLGAAADEVLMDTLVEVVGSHGRSVPIQPRVIQGRPVEELLRVARPAQLLVLGGPTHGTIVGLLRGSVSHQCVQRASCPVLIVPAGSSMSRPSSAARMEGRSTSHPIEGML